MYVAQPQLSAPVLLVITVLSSPFYKCEMPVRCKNEIYLHRFLLN